MPGAIAEPGEKQSAQDWLDALSGKKCDENEFVRAAQELMRKNPDAGWDLLSLLDQYYRRGKITTEVFRNVKLNLERALMGAADIKDSVPAAPKGPSPAAAASNAETVTTSGPTAASLGKPRHEIAVGDVLRGRYQISSVLYQGSMGTIFEASDRYRLELPNAAPRLAIKVLHNEVTQQAELLAQLRRDFQRLQSLSHPNIVRVHEYDRDGDTAFFTMEYLSGLSLRLLLAARQQVALNRSDARSIFRDVGAALAHAHHRGIVHGDLNPRNIFITDEGEVRVLEFGGSQTLRGGTADFSDDLYAFACVVYLLLAGKLPFGEHSAIQARTLRLRPTRPAGLTRRQWRALRSGLSFEPERRPADVEKFLEPFDLRETSDRLPALITLFKVPPERRSRKLWLALAAAASMILAGSWWAATNYDSVARTASAWSSELLQALGEAESSLTRLWHASDEHAAASSGPEPMADSTHPAEAATPTPAPPPEVSNSAAPQSTAAVPHVASSDERSTPQRSRLELATSSFEVPFGDPSAHIVIRRSGSLRAETSFSWWTETGTAKPGVDYESVAPHVESFAPGKSAASLFIPVVTDSTRREPKNFYVVIGDPGPNTTLGNRTVAMVSIEPSQ